MATTTPRAHLAGRVVAANDTGLRLSTRDGWLNYSKFKPLNRATVGDHVALDLDGTWIVAISFVDPAVPEPAPPGAGIMAAALDKADPCPAAATTTHPAVRIAALSAAATFLAPRPEARREHIVQLAEQLEAWLTRPT